MSRPTHSRKSAMDEVQRIRAAYVGRKGMMNLLRKPASRAREHRREQSADPGVDFAVEILNARYAWGHYDLLIQPHRGAGTAWVSMNRVRVVDDWPETANDGEPDPHRIDLPDAGANAAEAGEPRA